MEQNHKKMMRLRDNGQMGQETEKLGFEPRSSNFRAGVPSMTHQQGQCFRHERQEEDESSTLSA